MNTKWNLLLVVFLLAALVGGNTSAVMAQEIHYFTWDPAAPQEGGTVMFTATPPDGYASLEWSRSTGPGEEGCNLTIESAEDLIASTEFLESGDYQVCLHITFTDESISEIIDSQTVTVMNLPPTLGTAKLQPAATVLGYPVTASVPVTDYDSGLTCTVDFGDGTDPVTGILNGSCTALHAYTAAGTYTVTLSVTEPGFEPVTATASHTVLLPYANAVYEFTGTVQNETGALGASDGLYASIRGASSLMLDLGMPVQGATLTIYHSTRSPSCEVWIEVYSQPAAIGSTAAGADHTILSFPASMPELQYVSIQCGTLSKKAVFQLDAIHVAPAPQPDGYATFAMGGLEDDVQSAGAAVGAPDGVYASIGQMGGEIMLDMGEPLQGILTVYHSADSPACTILLAAQMPFGSTLPGATSTSLIIPPFGPGIPSYFSIECTGADNAVFELDAVQMGPTREPTGYALATFGYGVESAGAATGEPDGQYAAMNLTSNSSQLLLDMGDLVQGTILTIYHSSANESCQVGVSSDFVEGEPQPFGITMAGWESSTFEISQDFRYVWIDCEFSATPWDVFELDAVCVGTAADLSGHALAAYDPLGGVQNPGAALGAPDKEYATLSYGAEAMVLDLGAPMQGMLTLYHSVKSPMCEVAASLALSDLPEPDVMLGVTLTGTESTKLFTGEGYRYIWIYCSLTTEQVAELDAIYVDQSVIPTGYALTALGGSDVQNLDAAVGAPDAQFATMAVSGSQIVLDLGAVQQGILTAYLGQAGSLCQFAGTTTFFGATVRLDPIGWGPATYSIPVGGIRYVVIDCSLAAGEVFELDAVHAGPAPQPNGYGLQVVFASDDVQNAGAATGEPDGAYSAITAANGGLYLDMGELTQGILTVYHSKTSPVCSVYAMADFAVPDLQSAPVGMTLPGVEQSTILLTTEIRYLWITCLTLPKGAAFELDAVHVEPGTITPTGYGMAVLTVAGKVQNPLAATEGPDSQYATISAPSGTIVLDLGAIVQGSLTVYHSKASPSCAVALTDAVGGETAAIGYTTPEATSTVFEPTSGQYRYVMVACTTLAKRTAFQLDAVGVALPPP